MLHNYLVTGLRNIRKNALASLIAVAGFSVGIAGAILVFLYVQHELSFDRFLPGHERVHRVLLEATAYEGGQFVTAGLGMEAPNVLKSVSGVEYVTQVVGTDATLGYGDRHWYEQNTFYLTDSSFLKVFPYVLAAGDPATALERPLSLVLSRAMAKKYFGNENPLGETLTFQHTFLGSGAYYFTVTGVLDDLPSTSTFQFDFVANCPYEQVTRDALAYYNRTYDAHARRGPQTLLATTYVRLRSPSFLSSFQREVEGLANLLPQAEQRIAFRSCRLVTEPLDSLYLFSRVDSTSERRGNFLLILLLAGLGVIVIAIACLNAINLATARAMTRTKEIGVRKALGATRGELIVQYLVESMLLSLGSLLVALVVVELVLPLFDVLVRRGLSMKPLTDPGVAAGLVGLAALIGVLAGFYPAFYLSSFGVTRVLRGSREPRSRRLREALVVLQFVFSVSLFICSAVILRELGSVRVADLGFDFRDTLMVRLNVPEVEKRFPDIKHEVRQVPGVRGVTASSAAAWKYGGLVNDFPVTSMARTRYANVMVVDTDFLRVSGIRLSEGKDFGTDFYSPNVNQLIVNEAAQRQLGYNLNSFAYDQPLIGYVVGIARDFAYVYPSRRVAPLILTLRSPFLVNSPSTPAPVHLNYMLVKMQPSDHERVVRDVEAAWKRVCPGYSFEYRFVDKEIRDQMQEVTVSSQSVLLASTILAFLLSGLGLFGLASFEMERRTKEVGIRKALGATTLQVVGHFLLGFLRLVGLANLIAWPTAFVLLRAIFALLQYPRTPMVGPLVFMEVAALSAVVTVVAVGSQTLRAASANPVNTLRCE